jgi:hypothetical protein
MSGRRRQPFVRGRKAQANLVFEHMRRRIDLDVHGTPQGSPHPNSLAPRFAHNA